MKSRPCDELPSGARALLALCGKRIIITHCDSCGHASKPDSAPLPWCVRDVVLKLMRDIDSFNRERTLRNAGHRKRKLKKDFVLPILVDYSPDFQLWDNVRFGDAARQLLQSSAYSSIPAYVQKVRVA